jgi:hypothetical protein
MGQKLVGNSFVARAQFVDGATEIDIVPEGDGGNGEIETGGAIALVFESAVADFAEAMEEYGGRGGTKWQTYSRMERRRANIAAATIIRI